jgi:hypothetical protein
VQVIGNATPVGTSYTVTGHAQVSHAGALAIYDDPDCEDVIYAFAPGTWQSLRS